MIARGRGEDKRWLQEPGLHFPTAPAAQPGYQTPLLGIKHSFLVDLPLVMTVAAQSVAAVFVAGAGFAEGKDVGHGFCGALQAISSANCCGVEKICLGFSVESSRLDP